MPSFIYESIVNGCQSTFIRAWYQLLLTSQFTVVFPSILLWSKPPIYSIKCSGYILFLPNVIVLECFLWVCDFGYNVVRGIVLFLPFSSLCTKGHTRVVYSIIYDRMRIFMLTLKWNLLETLKRVYFDYIISILEII